MDSRHRKGDKSELKRKGFHETQDRPTLPLSNRNWGDPEQDGSLRYKMNMWE